MSDDVRVVFPKATRADGPDPPRLLLPSASAERRVMRVQRLFLLRVRDGHVPSIVGPYPSEEERVAAGQAARAAGFRVYRLNQDDKHRPEVKVFSLKELGPA